MADGLTAIRSDYSSSTQQTASVLQKKETIKHASGMVFDVYTGASAESPLQIAKDGVLYTKKLIIRDGKEEYVYIDIDNAKAAPSTDKDNNVTKIVDAALTSPKDDGKEVSWGSWFKHLGKGMLSPFKAMVSSPKNMIISAVAGAAIFGLCCIPVVGQFIGLGLAVGGALWGSYKIAAGAIKYNTAKNSTDKKLALEEAGGGVTELGLSLIGIKGAKASIAGRANAANALKGVKVGGNGANDTVTIVARSGFKGILANTGEAIKYGAGKALKVPDSVISSAAWKQAHGVAKAANKGTTLFSRIKGVTKSMEVTAANAKNAAKNVTLQMQQLIQDGNYRQASILAKTLKQLQNQFPDVVKIGKKTTAQIDNLQELFKIGNLSVPRTYAVTAAWGGHVQQLTDTDTIDRYKDAENMFMLAEEAEMLAG